MGVVKLADVEAKMNTTMRAHHHSSSSMLRILAGIMLVSLLTQLSFASPFSLGVTDRMAYVPTLVADEFGLLEGARYRRPRWDRGG